MNLRQLAVAFLAVFVVAGLLAAQEVTRGAIVVRVEDATGAVIPGAKVTIESRAQPSLEGETGGNGEILFSNLIPGNYDVRVTVEGFKTAEVKGVSLRLGERRAVVMAMEPGAVVQTVEVVGAAAGVDLATTTTGGHIEDTIYQTIPIERGISNAFFLAPGVSDGVGTCGDAQTEFCNNPSVGGGAGLDNLYLIDGVNVTHGGFGGFGTTTRVFGSLGGGTTTSFIKEVEIKSGGYEAQYGQSLGGIFNIITKTGGNEIYGAVFGYYSPNKLEARRDQSNDFRTTNFQGFETHGVMTLDFGFEVGGFIWKDRLFYFGSLNPVVNRFQRFAPQTFDAFTFGPGDCSSSTGTNPTAGCSDLGGHDIKERTWNYALKLTGQVTPDHRVEASLFGDPTVRKFGPQRRLTGSLDPVFQVPSDFSRLDFSNLNLAIRYNGVLTPTWLVNAHFGNNHNRFEEQALFEAYRTSDFTVSPTQTFGGVGFFENGSSDEKLFSVDNTNIFSGGLLGRHELTEGFYFATNRWKGLSRRTGADFPVVSDPLIVRPEDIGKTTFGGDFDLISCQQETGTADCFGAAPAVFQGPTDTFIAVQARGDFFGADFRTTTRYTAAYVQDNWQMNKYLTLKLGLRWEQEEIFGNQGVGYVFTGSWGPRVGVILDPFGKRKTKVSFNFARFFQRIPNDLAQRIFSGEQSYIDLKYWVGPSKLVIPDQAHYIGASRCPDGSLGYVCDLGGSAVFDPGTFSGSEGIPPVPGTKMAYQDEFGIGIQHEFAGGVVVGTRYIDRRIKRATEDSNAVTIEQIFAGLFNIPFILINPSATGDNFINPVVISVGSAPCFPGTVDGPGPGLCWTANSGDPGSDGLEDGLPNAIREYQAVEITLERRMRDNWQFFANWRIARLQGNFEGSFRNDNGQTDPALTSLFDFTDSPAVLALYQVGPLPNDRQHVINAYGSYMFNEGVVNGLNIGFGLRVSSGKPLTELLAHPAFRNAGEIPCLEGNLAVTKISGAPLFSTECGSSGRGGAGQTLVFATADLHADYPVRITERFTLRGSLDFFNLFNATRERGRREFREVRRDILDPDFFAPVRFQRPFKMRVALRLEF